MPIPPEISATFPSDTRDRGQQYYRRGVVRITSVDERGIGATVRGSETYQVQLSQSPTGEFVHECSCPAWGSYGVCKHVWATLLAADAQRLLRFDGLPRTRARGPGAVKPPELSWKRKLRRIRDRIPPFDPTSADSRFPSDRRIVYVVDLPATRLYQRGLVVDLTTQRRAPNGEWGTPKQFSLREDQWTDAPDRVGVAAFTAGGWEAHELGTHLADRGIAVRAGSFCAHPFVAHLLGVESTRTAWLLHEAECGEDVTIPGAVRASIGLATTRADVDALLNAVAEAAAVPAA